MQAGLLPDDGQREPDGTSAASRVEDDQERLTTAFTCSVELGRDQPSFQYRCPVSSDEH